MTTNREGLNPADMAPAYEPGAVEEALYEWWESSGFFKPSGGRTPDSPPFCIIMPPPNLTGELHMGHALTTAIEDSLTRWHRMLGDDTLWQPGVDHAAIAVNAIIERDLAREGISRHDIGREEFLNRTWEFVRKSRSRIAVQHRRLGASADWSREAFTMDGEREVAVRTTFKHLYDDGLIYRAEDPWSLGAVLYNLNEPHLQLLGTTTNPDPVHRAFAVGGSYLFRDTLLLTGDVRSARFHFDELRINAGAEIWFFDTLALRSGLYEGNVTMGLGLQDRSWRADFALETHEEVGDAYILSFTLRK